MTGQCSSTMSDQVPRIRFATWIIVAAFAWWTPRTAHASCNDVHTLLLQGYSLEEIAQGLGVSVNQVAACANGARSMRSRQGHYDVVGPSPYGAAGPPPLGAAGPPPLGAAGPPPLGAAGPPPLGAAGPPPLGAAGPPPLGAAGSMRR